jgi:AcrR family transcriptional regulator
MSASQIQRKPASRDTIISEALNLAEEEGWNSVTVRAISNRLGYAPPVLYSFFKNKDHLIKHILHSGFELLNARMRNALDRKKTAEAQLLELSTERFAFAMDEPAIHALMFATSWPTWHRDEVFSGMCQIRNMVQSLVQEISGREDDCMDLITNFIAIMKGYTYFATELPRDIGNQNFFGSDKPEQALKNAMTRFIYSIKQND